MLGTWTVIAGIYTKDNERITCVTAEVDYSKQAVRELEHERFWRWVEGGRKEDRHELFHARPCFVVELIGLSLQAEDSRKLACFLSRTHMAAEGHCAYPLFASNAWGGW